jgi:hypothetical protein
MNQSNFSICPVCGQEDGCKTVDDLYYCPKNPKNEHRRFVRKLSKVTEDTSDENNVDVPNTLQRTRNS